MGSDPIWLAHDEVLGRGDAEVVLRSVFRQTPQPQWKDLMQRISYAMGYSGTVSDISASKPEAVGEPFHIAYSYNRKDYPDWKSDKRITVPGMPFFMPTVHDDSIFPVWLGSPMEAVSDSKVELPQGYEPQLPPNVDLKYDFAEYHASYSRDHSVLTAKRRLITKLREVPVAEFDDYRSFVKNLDDDVNRYVYTTPSNAASLPTIVGPPNIPSLAALSPTVRALRELPESNSQDANRLEAEARDEMAKQNLQGAVSSLSRAVSADQKFTRAWLMLGELLFAQKKTVEGIDAFHKAMAVDPEERAIPKALGMSLMANSEFEDALPVWQDYINAHPDDSDGPANLGACLEQLKRYSEAAGTYEAALKIQGDRSNLQRRLASVYLLSGEREKAAAAFAKLAEADPKGNTFNDAAYEMANADLKLPLALDYANKAVRAAEEESQKITLADLKVEDLGKIFKVAAYWDTLGWVNERMSNLDAAELYLRASWRLTQDGVVAGHLCHMYRREHKYELAVQMCRMAIYRMPTTTGGMQIQAEMAAAKENLQFLTKGAPNSKGATDASDLVIKEREFKLPRFLIGTESAEFFVLLTSDGKSKKFKVEEVKFISGSDKMKLQGRQLKSIDFNVPAPDDVPAHFLRRGILGCYQYTGCSFVLLDPATVQSVN